MSGCVTSEPTGKISIKFDVRDLHRKFPRKFDYYSHRSHIARTMREAENKRNSFVRKRKP
jgi:hypothetical protein